MKDGWVDVQAVMERVDIVSVISRYLTLTRSGAEYKGRCPFHKDDTPSLMVNPEKGLWHCFGCGEGGNVFTFLMKIERLSFPEAAERLAAMAGIPFKQKVDGEKEQLWEVNAEAASYFFDNLTDKAAGRKAREYLFSRGYGEETWGRFGLGYALPGWDNLKGKFAKRHGVKTLIDLGLLVKGKESTLYDRFRDRVIFPIYDLSERPIAFGGRAFEEQPKYLNSPKTVLFDKGRHLYGLSWAREELSSRRSAILVEGYTDVLSLHLAGITHAIGSMGTALTQEQANLLGRFVKEVVIVYDSDAAGGAASLRGMMILRNSGLNVRISLLPKGDDPDSLVHRDGAERMLEIVEEAIPFHLFYIESLKGRYDLSTLDGKEGVLAEAKGFYQGITSLPLRHEIATLLAEILKLTPEGVMADLSGRRSQRRAEGKLRKKENNWGEEEVILSLLLRGDVEWERVASLLSPEDFSEDYRPIVEAFATASEPFNLSSLMKNLDEEIEQKASYLMMSPLKFNNKEKTLVEKALQDAITKLVKLPAIEKQLAMLREEIKRSEEVGDRGRLDELMRVHRSLVVEKLSKRGTNGKR